MVSIRRYLGSLKGWVLVVDLGSFANAAGGGREPRGCMLVSGTVKAQAWDSRVEPMVVNLIRPKTIGAFSKEFQIYTGRQHENFEESSGRPYSKPLSPKIYALMPNDEPQHPGADLHTSKSNVFGLWPTHNS